MVNWLRSLKERNAKKLCLQPTSDNSIAEICAGCGVKLFRNQQGQWKPAQLQICPFGE
jgi:hypothetical protein